MILWGIKLKINIQNAFKLFILLIILIISVGMVYASDTMNTNSSLTDEINSNEIISESAIEMDDGLSLTVEENQNTGKSDSNSILEAKTIEVQQNSNLEAKTIEVQHTGNDLSDIKNAINSASNGDTVYLGSYEYTIGDGQIDLSKSITLLGDGNTIINARGGEKSGCVIEINRINGATIKGIKFNNYLANLTYTDQDTLYGWAIRLDNSKNIIIDNCSFINYNRAVNIAGSGNNKIINSHFTGIATRVTNGAGKERGSRCIATSEDSYDNIIQNNTFDGAILDAINLDSARNTQILDNRFINNAYSIYLDKSATTGLIVRNNEFTNCGHFEATFEGDEIRFNDLPIICARESFDNFAIEDNVFNVNESNVIIYCYSTNSIGNVNITKNKVNLLSEGIDASSVTFFKLPSTEEKLDLIGDIVLSSNDLPSNMVYGNIGGNIYYEDFTLYSESIPTILTISHAEKIFNGNFLIGFTLYGILKDNSYKKLNGNISVEFNEKTYNVKIDDSLGQLLIDENLPFGNYTAYAKFMGNYLFRQSDCLKTIEIADPNQNQKTIKNTKFIFSNMNTVAIGTNDGSKAKYFKFTLKDQDNNPLRNKTVLIAFNGKTYTKKTDDNGIVKLAIKLKNKGTYHIVLSYLGDEDFKGSFAMAKVTVKAQKPKLVFKSKSNFKANAKTKKITVKLLSLKGKGIKSKKISLKIKGKTYSTKTNSKGIATFKIKINKKGTYKYTVSFGGDNTYSKFSKKASIVVK